MRVIAHKTLVRYVDSLTGQTDQASVRGALTSWYEEVRKAEWQSPAEVKAVYRNASIVGDDRVVFNIKGNDYRLVVAIDYRLRIVFVKWFGTHEAYDRIDVRTVAYGN